jgi:signal transduction histidine kinase
MSSPWTWALIIMALVALYCSSHVPRAWRWIGAGGLSFFATTLFLDYSPAPQWHPLFTFGCDAAVCFLIFFTYMEHGGSDWELGVFLAFLCSTLASLLRMGGFVPDNWVYPAMLELCNAGALLWIISTGLIEMVGRHENSPVHRLRAGLLHPRDPV